MFKLFKLGVLKKGVVTRPYPQERFEPADAFLGLPVADLAGCDRCGRCVRSCPSSALALVEGGLELDVGRCLFCAACAQACPACIRMGREFELSARRRDELRVVFPNG